MKIKKIIPLFLLVLGLASCTSTSDSTVTEVSTSEKQSEKTSNSVTTVVPVSSESTAPSPTSSESTSTSITKSVDMATLSAVTKEDFTAADGFFKIHTMSAEPGKRIKTDATSDVKKSKAVIEFTVTGSGKVSISAKSGSSKNFTRLFLAELTGGEVGETAEFNYLSAHTVSPSYEDIEFILPKAGTYLILSNQNTSIQKLEVTYTEGTTTEAPVVTPAITDSNVLTPYELLPGTYTDQKVGNFTINGDIEYKGQRTLTGYTLEGYTNALLNDCFNLAAGKTLKFEASGQGTLSFYALSSDSAVAPKLGHKKAGEAEFTYETTALPLGGEKTLTAVNISIPEAGTYEFTVDSVSALIFIASFAAI